jgi:DNA invertase Pin-like site-specific DNA recombinase
MADSPYCGERVVKEATTMRVCGYVRVSTQEQSDSGAGLEAQRQAIEAEAARREWELVSVYVDVGVSGKSLNRPGLADALAAVENGDAAAIIVQKLDRLSRSVHDFAGLMQRAQRRGWALVAMDLAIDTTTPTGGLVANVMASVAEWERRVIGQRTKDALAVVRANGSKSGRPIGNPNFRPVPAPIVALIRQLRGEGMSYRRLADELNRRQIPTAQGGARWHSKTVYGVVKREQQEAA